jgi:hypothetical protein
MNWEACGSVRGAVLRDLSQNILERAEKNHVYSHLR